jgi:hypothetical protein
MQENEFERSVREQMDEFSLVPTEAVWKEVEARIRERKHKRLFFIWLFAGLLLLGGTTWWMIENGNKKDFTDASSKTSSIKQEKRVEQQKIKQENRVATKEDIKPEKKAVQITGKKEMARAYKKANVDKTFYSDKTRRAAAPAALNPGEDIVEVGKQKPIKQNPVQDDYEGEAKKEPQQNLILHKYYKSPQELQEDSLRYASTAKNKTLPITGTAEATIIAKDNKVKRNSFRFGISGYAGISDNTSGIRLIATKSVSPNALYSSGALSSGAMAASTPPLTYKAAGSYGLGVFVNKSLSKRTTMSTGLDYHYFSARSSVGSRINNSQRLYDTALDKDTYITSFYSAGQNTSYTNKYHVVQLPINLQFALNRNINKPFQLSIGLSPAFLIGSDALYLNSYQRIYYKEKRQFKNFIIFGQTGLMFTPFKANEYEWSLGPMFQYGFNSFSKWQTQTNQHLLFTGIKSNITFK